MKAKHILQRHKTFHYIFGLQGKSKFKVADSDSAEMQWQADLCDDRQPCWVKTTVNILTSALNPPTCCGHGQSMLCFMQRKEQSIFMFVQNNRIQDKGLVIRLELSSHADSEGE